MKVQLLASANPSQLGSLASTLPNCPIPLFSTKAATNSTMLSLSNSLSHWSNLEPTLSHCFFCSKVSAKSSLLRGPGANKLQNGSESMSSLSTNCRSSSSRKSQTNSSLSDKDRRQKLQTLVLNITFLPLKMSELFGNLCNGQGKLS